MPTGNMVVAILGFVAPLVGVSPAPALAQGYTVVDTDQSVCYDDDGAAISVTGLLSERIQDRDFRQAECLGTFDGEGDDSRPDPSAGGGDYYLSKGLDACASRGYGEALGVRLDPRDFLDSLDPCP